MSSPPPPAKPVPARPMARRAVLSLHRRMGIISALFVVILSVSGIVLHHTAGLGLDSQFVRSPSLLAWYGIDAPAVSASFAAGEHRVTLIGDSLYFDRLRLPGQFAALRGVAPLAPGYVVASASQLVLLTAAGEVVETLGAVHGVPPALREIGIGADGELYLRSQNAVYAADLDALRFTVAATPPAIAWSTAAPAAALEEAAIRNHYAASLLSWERLLMDIHSGRLLGNAGVVLVDLMALLFIAMAATGVWIWSRRRPR